MVETNTDNFNNGSSIASLASSRLFTILLLLPIDSILSFVMACDKSMHLASLDNLWESVCRKGRGNTDVGALKSSFHVDEQQHRLLPWINFYKHVFGLARFVVTTSPTQILIWSCPLLEHLYVLHSMPRENQT
ncbi:hypothetical protein GQ457_03G009370 [Hibiscus cannabinus]